MPTEEERLRQNQAIQDWINTVSSPNFGAAPYGAAPAGATTGARVVDQGWEGGGGDWTPPDNSQEGLLSQYYGSPPEEYDAAQRAIAARAPDYAANIPPREAPLPSPTEPPSSAQAPYDVAANIGGAAALAQTAPVPGAMSRSMYNRLAQTQQPIPGTAGFASYDEAHPQGGFQDVRILPNGMRVSGLSPLQMREREDARLNAEIDQMTGGLPLSQSERMQMQQYVRGMAEVRKRLENGTLGLQEAHAAIRLLREVYNPLEQRQKAEEVRGRMLLNQQRAEELGIAHFGQAAGLHALADALPGAVRSVPLPGGGTASFVPNSRGGYDQVQEPKPEDAPVTRRERAAQIHMERVNKERRAHIQLVQKELKDERESYEKKLDDYRKALADWNKDTSSDKGPRPEQPEMPAHMLHEDISEAEADYRIERNLRRMNMPNDQELARSRRDAVIAAHHASVAQRGLTRTGEVPAAQARRAGELNVEAQRAWNSYQQLLGQRQRTMMQAQQGQQIAPPMTRGDGTPAQPEARQAEQAPPPVTPQTFRPFEPARVESQNPQQQQAMGTFATLQGRVGSLPEARRGPVTTLINRARALYAEAGHPNLMNGEQRRLYDALLTRVEAALRREAE